MKMKIDSAQRLNILSI